MGVLVVLELRYKAIYVFHGFILCLHETFLVMQLGYYAELVVLEVAFT